MATKGPRAAATRGAESVSTRQLFPKADFSRLGLRPSRVIGRTGLEVYSGLVSEEFLTALTGARAHAVYKEMQYNDATVGAMLTAAEQLVHNVSINFQVADSSQEALRARDLVQTALFDMHSSWRDVQSETMSFFTYGWSYLQLSLKKRSGYSRNPLKTSRHSDGMLGWADAMPHSQSGLVRWDLDDHNRVQGIRHRAAPDQREYFIPRSRSLHFRTKSVRWNPEGFSVLRNAFRCFSADTDILAEDGWKPISTVVVGERVATLNPATEELEYHPVDDVHSYDYDGKMFHQSGRFIDLMVTPNHRLWVRREGVDYFEFIDADSLWQRHVCYKRDVCWKGREADVFVLPSITHRNGRVIPDKRIPMDAWLRLFGIWLAEGHTYRAKGNTRKAMAGITQKRGKRLEIIKGWIRSAGYSYYEHKHGECAVLEICNLQLYTYLHQFGGSHDKFVPRELKQLSPRQLSILYDAMHFGDGSVSGGADKYIGTRIYLSVSRRLIDDVAEIQFKRGYAPTIGKARKRNPSSFGKNHVWIVSEGRARKGGNHVNLLRDQREWIDYSGKVYCVTVPNHLVYVRRNGKACWSGNSWIFKKKFEEIEGIGIERDLTGLPVLTPPENLDLWNDKNEDARAARTMAENVVRSVRVDKHMGLVLPFDWTFTLAASEGSRQHNVGDVISRYDQRIAGIMLADMILIGHERVGSFALIAAKMKLFSAALESYARGISDEWNKRGIPDLVALNGIDPLLSPTMQFGPIETPNLKELGAYVSSIRGAQIDLDRPLENYLRAVANFPPLAEGEPVTPDSPEAEDLVDEGRGDEGGDGRADDGVTPAMTGVIP